MSVGIYFATTTGKTEDIAERLHGLLNGANPPKDLSDLDDLAYSINLEFDSYVKSTGAPIAQNLRTFDIFTFNINMLLKYSST